MDRQKRKLFWLVAAGLFCVVFLTLLTISFYNYVLQQIGVDHAENTRTYRYHFVMLTEDVESQFWQDVYDSVSQEAAKAEAFVELKGRKQALEYTMTDYMDMAIASDVDGILLEYTGEEQLAEKINEAAEKGIPVVTILNDAPNTRRKSYVGINSYQLGQEYGNQILGLIREKQDQIRIVVLLHDQSVDSNQSQIFNQINNRMVTSGETAGWVRVEEVRVPSNSAFETERIVWDLFQGDQQPPDIVVCMDEMDTQAVYQAVIDHNRVGETQIIGYYRSSTTLEAVRRGTMAMSLCIDTGEMGRYSVRAMMESLKDGRTNSFYSAGLQFVTQENAKQYMEEQKE